MGEAYHYSIEKINGKLYKIRSTYSIEFDPIINLNVHKLIHGSKIIIKEITQDNPKSLENTIETENTSNQL